jgi:ADP-ribosyl-[dinitrogen reductase] hydrolase
MRGPLRHRFVLGRGMVSDDTDHSIFVAQAISRHPKSPETFAASIAWKLRFWLLCLPAGIGLATLRSILRLWVGIPPSRSGVFSAGNGAAMRSAIIGVYHHDDPLLRRSFVSASSRITHSDPKANFGALAVAEIAAHEAAKERPSRPSLEALRELLDSIGDEDHWKEVVERTLRACSSSEIVQALPEGTARKGVSGYVYHTVPVAIAAWYLHYGDARSTVERVVLLGGDTDSVAAIAGALAGASLGSAAFPKDWIAGILDRPHSPSYLRDIGARMARGERTKGFSPWLLPRGAVFTLLVLLHGFRRLLPPY